jgi:AAA domain
MKKDRTVRLDFKAPDLPTQGRIASTVKPQDADWLWWPYIPAGSITIIGARGGTGKGVLCADLAAKTSRGEAWPFSGGETAPLGNVMWCETEDSFKTTVVPRLIAAKADRRRIILIKPDEFFSKKNLRRRIEQEGICLIVMSPLNSFLEDLKDANSGQSVREALEKVQSNIEDTRCAVIAICHLNKKPDLAAIERLLGSVEYANYVRSVLMLRADDDGVRIVHAKHNLSIQGNDLLFTVHNRQPVKHPRGQFVSIDWEKANENINQDNLFDRKEGESASVWLSRLLADGEEMECTQIFKQGKLAGHSEGALKQAKSRNPAIKHRFTERFGNRTQNTFWYMER